MVNDMVNESHELIRPFHEIVNETLPNFTNYITISNEIKMILDRFWRKSAKNGVQSIIFLRKQGNS